MGYFARIADGVVAETVHLPGDLTPAEAFHADLTFVPCDQDTRQGWLQGQDGSFSAPPAAAPTEADVNAERDRRFGLGAPVMTTSGKTFRADTDETGRTNLMGLVFAAQQDKDGTATFAFRDHGNETQQLSTADVLETAAQAMARVSAIYAASWELKGETIPADYAVDAHWPTPA